jgi:hypothetical protein
MDWTGELLLRSKQVKRQVQVTGHWLAGAGPRQGFGASNPLQRNHGLILASHPTPFWPTRQKSLFGFFVPHNIDINAMLGALLSSVIALLVQKLRILRRELKRICGKQILQGELLILKRCW